MRASLPVLLIILLAVAASAPPTHIAQAQSQVSWKEYTMTATAILAYDADGDGYKEILVLPYRVIDNYVDLRSPYPPSTQGMTIDIDGDYERELILYSPVTGDYYVYEGQELVEQFSLDPGAPVLSMYGRAIASGTKVYYNHTVYSFPDAESPIVPIVSGSLWALYHDGQKLLLVDTIGNTSYTVYPDTLTPLGAVLYFGELYAVAKAPGGGIVYIEYPLGGSAAITGYTIEADRVLGFDPTENAFIVASADRLYKVGPETAVLLAIGKPLYSDGVYIYLYSDGNLVLLTLTGETYTKVELPVNREPDIVGGVYPYIGVAYDDKVYILSLEAQPEGYLQVALRVYAGEPFQYSAVVYNAKEYRVLLNGVPIPPEGTLTLNASGTYTLTLTMTNGIVVIEKNYTVTVEPRPLYIYVEALNDTVAYGKTALRPYVEDTITGSLVYGIKCTLIVNGVEYQADANEPIVVDMTPKSIEDDAAEVTLTCGDGSYYAVATYTTTIPYQPGEPRLQVAYLGGGDVKLGLTVPTNSSLYVPGTLDIYVDGDYYASGSNPFMIKLEPGNHTIEIVLNPTVPTFTHTTYKVTLYYYSNISEVPEYVETVYIADRIINQTRVVVRNQTITQTQTITLPPVEIEKLDVVLAMIFFGAGVGGGFIIGLLLGGRRTRPPSEFSIPEETGKGEEVDLEPPG